MKKLVLSLAVLAGFSTAAHAQAGVKYGVKGGWNLATFSGTDSNGSGYKNGFDAGLFFRFGFSDMVSVQPEFLYSQKGATLDNFQARPGGDVAKFKSTIGYLDVPVLVRVNTGDEGKGFFFELGPQGSFLLHNRDFTQTGNLGTQSNENTSKDDLNKVVIGYAAGLGYQITSGLSLGVRYTGDFSQVYKDGNSRAYPYKASTTTFGQNPNVHNSVFQFQVGYLFGGKG